MNQDVWIQHVAGPFVNERQRCKRCLEILVDQTAGAKDHLNTRPFKRSAIVYTRYSHVLTSIDGWAPRIQCDPEVEIAVEL